MDKRDRPWVILNAAITADGKIDTVERTGAKISSDEDWSRVDRLRASVDAVMVGGNTLLAEDPRLTVKSPVLREERLAAGLPENPAKVGVISVAALPPHSRFLTDSSAEVLIFTTGKTSVDQHKSLRNAGARVYIAEGDRVDLPWAMQMLKSEGIDRLLLEGGGTLNAAMFASGLIDEIRLYIAPRIFSGASAPTLADGPGFALGGAVSLETTDIQSIPDGGILVTYLVEPKS